jgi:hypothetical protein
MGRKPGVYKPKRLPLTLIEPTHKILEILVKTGGYGNNTTDAARVIIMKHIQELDSQKKIELFEPPPDAINGTKK